MHVFVVSRSDSDNLRAMTKMCGRLRNLAPGPLHTLPIGTGWYLTWTGGRPVDNLHVFSDGVFVGKLAFSEPTSLDPSHHAERMPAELHPLLRGVRIRAVSGDPEIEPHGIANVFVRDDTVSDHQLLIADIAHLLPSTMSLATLCLAGYLPGNLSLFDGIDKIPLLASYNLGAKTMRRTGLLPELHNDDDALVERIVSIVPGGVRSYHGLSGGYDSRFVLGCLLSAGVQPTIIHILDAELPIVKEIAEQLHLDLKVCPTDAPKVDRDLYTLVTDGQIYFDGGKYGKVRYLLDPESVYHSGQFSESTMKLVFNTAWKMPGSRATILDRLIRYALLTAAPPVDGCLRDGPSDEALRGFLGERLEFEKTYYAFPTGKQDACWFYYMNRGVRWVQAQNADLSYFTYPVFLMSDLPALANGNASAKLGNLNNERVRRLNHRLLPNLTVGYADGHPATRTESTLQTVVCSICNEYGKRALKYFRDRKAIAEGAQQPVRPAPTPVPDSSGTSFRRYFTGELSDIAGGRFPSAYKRAARTLYDVLAYLEDDSREPARPAA